MSDDVKIVTITERLLGGLYVGEHFIPPDEVAVLRAYFFAQLDREKVAGVIRSTGHLATAKQYRQSGEIADALLAALPGLVAGSQDSAPEVDRG